MNTPICDFVNQYCSSEYLRLHMPGHKGRDIFGFEKYDITEVVGADSLYEADGIISESEKNTSAIFGAETFYSTEGSSLSIRAMLYLTCLYATQAGKKPLIWAGRNAHKSFLSAAVLLDFDIEWLYGEDRKSYLSCKITAENLNCKFTSVNDSLPVAVYLTSPDYLGNLSDIKSIAEICRKFGVLLLVDNAHGSYLKFLNESSHPIDLGADMCCDSAHKTLPVITGGGYLHISKKAPGLFKSNAKNALALFGSTSPSYLILQSLDMANKLISNEYKEKLNDFVKDLNTLKKDMSDYGFTLLENEPLKLTIDAKKIGYSGNELAEILHNNNIVCEFSDPDFLVLMFTPNIEKAEIDKLKNVLFSIKIKNKIAKNAPQIRKAQRVYSPREAAFMPNEKIPSNMCKGRILAVSSVGCPPAVPIVVGGEKIDATAIECFEYFGIKKCTVIK